jgi:hypothetical protein
VDDIRQNLAHRGYAVVSKMVPACIRSAVADEALQLVEEVGVRRDLMIEETGFTPRRMRNVTRAQIVERGSVIQQVYESSWMAGMLAEVVGEALYPCPYEPEQFVVTRLERASDTHGWHWDDYGFALVWVAECPPPVDGGYVECVPNTTWDKQRPGIDELLRDRPVYTLAAGGGGVYLMRTDTTLHRVHPIRRGRRTIVNMAFATAGELCIPVSHETMDTLWSMPEVRANGAE